MNPALSLKPTKPAKDCRSAPERLRDHLEAWLATGPRIFTGETTVEVLRAAASTFADHSGEKKVTTSDALNRFEIGLDFAGYRANSIVYGGKTKWLLVLPESNIKRIE